MIHIHDLSKTYNGVTVLKIDELQIPKGESFGLVGNNGAGKTTLFSALLDLIQPTTGYIQNGEVKVHESEAWKSHTASFIDESFLIGYLTAEEYFYFIGELRGQNKADVDKLLAAADSVNEDIKNIIKKLPTAVPEFLRTAKNLTEKEWKDLTEQIKNKKQ